MTKILGLHIVNLPMKVAAFQLNLEEMCMGIQLEGGGRKGEGLFRDGYSRNIFLSQRFIK